jgi:hypothetical protein
VHLPRTVVAAGVSRFTQNVPAALDPDKPF